MTTCVITDHDQPVDTDVGLLCADHFSRLRSQLLELPAVANWLRVNLAAGGNGISERVAGSREDPIPLRPDVLDLIGPDSLRFVTRGLDDQRGAEAIRATLAYYAQQVHEQAEAAFPAATAVVFDGRVVGEFARAADAGEALRQSRWQARRLVDPHRWRLVVVPARAGWADRASLVDLADFLAAHLSWLAARSWVAELFVEVQELGRQAHRVAPWREEIRRDRDPCTRCGAPAVVLHLASGVSRCEPRAGGCGRRQPLSEYVLNAVLPQTRRSA